MDESKVCLLGVCWALWFSLESLDPTVVLYHNQEASSIISARSVSQVKPEFSLKIRKNHDNDAPTNFGSPLGGAQK